jgi:hypothetical protein
VFSIRSFPRASFACLFVLGCSGAPQPSRSAAPGPVFNVVRFFEGRSEGQARLKVIFKPARSVHVQSRGQVQPDGTLLLVQEVREEGEAPRTREWRMREVSPGRFSGTLTDAVGPVAAESSGNRFHVRYRMKGGFQAEQWLTLQPDGRTVQNLMHVTKLKVRVATLEETIRKLD